MDMASKMCGFCMLFLGLWWPGILAVVPGMLVKGCNLEFHIVIGSIDAAIAL